MLKPVKASFYDDTKLVGFAHFASDAEAMLGLRVKSYQITLPYRAETSTQAWDFAHTLQLCFTKWIKENMGYKDPRGPLPHVVHLPANQGYGYTLTLDFFLPEGDLSIPSDLTLEPNHD